MDDLKGRQQLYNGFGDTLARGFEIALTPFLFGGLGWFLDRVLGWTPILTIALAVFAIIGLAVRTYYRYEEEMRVHEEDAPWANRQARRSTNRPEQSASGPRQAQ
jgi:hypothetical protein